jgi:hypothetical protein
MRLALVALAFIVFSTASAQADPPQHATKSPAEISAYWTKERMRSAVPRERAKPGGGGGGGSTSSWSRLAVPTPYTGSTLTNGKVFMTLHGTNYVCSGTSVQASASLSLVWTAGHCTNEGPGAYVTNFMFAPGYIDGTTPYGKWTFSSILTTSQFANSGDLMYDFGAARVVPGDGAPPNSTLADIPGATPRPMAFNYTVTTSSTKFKSYGYPAAGKFNGQRLQVCDSTVIYRDGTDMGIGCDMTGGSSGGGWIDSAGALGSVNSYGYNSLKNVMFGPYQGSVAQALYQSMD